VHLHAAAQRIVGDFDGVVPERIEDLRSLAGVGPYVASAVREFAFEKRSVVVDVNIARVLSRVCSRRRSLDARAAPARIAALAERYLPPRAHWAWTQALMDVGALFCKARVARCAECPLRRACASAGALTARPPKCDRRDEPSWRSVPNRIWRGRIVEMLRGTMKGMTIAAIAKQLKCDDREWLRRIVAGLERDRVVLTTHRRVRV
jgi:A/G-specific adenine glycosylase